MAGLVGISLAHAACALDSNKAMSQYIHDKWGTDQGFLGGAVYAICQSGDGYLWIGTERGLVRFDGFNFVLFQRPIPELPPIGAVRGLVSDADGNLWIRLEGPNMLLYRNGKFEDAFAHFNRDQDTFTAMSRDREGGLLLSALNDRILRYRNRKFESIVTPEAVPGTIISLEETLDGRVWLGTRDDGLFRLNNGHIYSASKELADSKINTLLASDGGGLWIGTDRGALFWEGDHLSKEGLPSSTDRLVVLSMIKDMAGNTWVGTDHGLIRISLSGAVSLDLLNRNADDAVSAIYEDRDGDLWFGGARGIERLRDGMFTTYSTTEGLPSGNNGSVYVDSDGRTWFAPFAGALAAIGNLVACVSLFLTTDANARANAITAIDLAVMSIALVLLGPGATSLDAKLFGRREIIIPERRRPTKP